MLSVCGEIMAKRTERRRRRLFGSMSRPKRVPLALVHFACSGTLWWFDTVVDGFERADESKHFQIDHQIVTSCRNMQLIILKSSPDRFLVSLPP